MDLDEIPSGGWGRLSVGVYVKSLSTVKDSTGSMSVKYTVPSGDYKGITIQKAVSAKQMSISYPAWYGVSTNRSADVAQSFI